MPMRTVLGFVAYVADTGGGRPTILKGAQGKVYSVNDTGLTTPLACRDIATEAVIPNPVSNEDGFILPFKVSISDTASGILWVAGGYAIYQPFLGVKGEKGEKGDQGGLDAAASATIVAAQSVVDRADSGEFKGDPGNATIRVDNTVGERIFVSDGATEHMVSGDTGWRNIRSLLSDTDVAAGGTAEIRRTENTVELNLYDCRTTTAGTLTLIEAITIGSGFWPRDKAAFSISVGNVNREAIVFANGRVRVYSIATTERVRASIMWTTAQPWPTTLPGTPT